MSGLYCPEARGNTYHLHVGHVHIRPAIPPHFQLPERGEGGAQVVQQLVVFVVFAVLQLEAAEKRQFAAA